MCSKCGLLLTYCFKHQGISHPLWHLLVHSLSHHLTIFVNSSFHVSVHCDIAHCDILVYKQSAQELIVSWPQLENTLHFAVVLWSQRQDVHPQLSATLHTAPCALFCGLTLSWSMSSYRNWALFAGCSYTSSQNSAQELQLKAAGQVRWGRWQDSWHLCHGLWLGSTVWCYVNALSRGLAAVGLRHACITAYSAVSLCLALNQLVKYAGCDGSSCRRCPVWGGSCVLEKACNSFFELDIHSMNACAMSGHDKKRRLEWKSCLS